MTLTNIEQPAQTITDVTNEIRQMIGQAVSIAEGQLHRIRSLVRAHTRAAIASELGDDAQAMLTVYTKLKEAIEAAKDITVEDLPS